MLIIGTLIMILGYLGIIKTNRNIKILRRFTSYGAQPICVRVIKKKRLRFFCSSIFQIDKRLQDFFVCTFTIEGENCKGYLPFDASYKIGREYFISCFYYPDAKLLLPKENKSYKLKVQKCSIPYLRPLILVCPPE